MTDKGTNEPREVGFVHFAIASDAAKALQDCNNQKPFENARKVFKIKFANKGRADGSGGPGSTTGSMGSRDMGYGRGHDRRRRSRSRSPPGYRRRPYHGKRRSTRRGKCFVFAFAFVFVFVFSWRKVVMLVRYFYVFGSASWCGVFTKYKNKDKKKENKTTTRKW